MGEWYSAHSDCTSTTGKVIHEKQGKHHGTVTHWYLCCNLSTQALLQSLRPLYHIAFTIIEIMYILEWYLYSLFIMITINRPKHICWCGGVIQRLLIHKNWSFFLIFEEIFKMKGWLGFGGVIFVVSHFIYSTIGKGAYHLLQIHIQTYQNNYFNSNVVYIFP